MGHLPDMQAKCDKYPLFASKWSSTVAHGVFWGNLTAILVLLNIAACSFSCSEKRRLKLLEGSHLVYFKKDLENAQNENERRQIQEKIEIYKSGVKRCIFVSAGCVIVGVVLLVVITSAALNLQYCDQEDLIFFFWTMWGWLSPASVVATLGILLQQWRALSHPAAPWNTALGTPILLVASIANWIYDPIYEKLCNRMLQKVEAKNEGGEGGMSEGENLTETRTANSSERSIPTTPTKHSTLLLPDAGITLTYTTLPPSIHSTAEVLQLRNGNYIVHYPPGTERTFFLEVVPLRYRRHNTVAEGDFSVLHRV